MTAADPARTQRWRERRESFRVRGEAFRPGDFGVEIIPGDSTARDFVVRHHYSAAYPSTSVRVGLFASRGPVFAPELVGVATFGTGVSQESIPRWAPGLTAHDGLQLGRFVLLDEVPFNAETWFLTRAFAVLREARPALRVVLSYSDPMPRRDDAGRQVSPGHVGSIYQAKGALFVGRTDPETKWLDARGCVLDGRSLAKVRALDKGGPRSKGGASFAGHLRALGAPARRPHEAWTGWVKRITWGGEGPFAALRHPGNLAYLFGANGLAFQGRDALPAGALPAAPYPKLRDLRRTE